jgi:REP element-mobilizing transposase RayT
MKKEVPSGRMKKGSEVANSYLSLYVHLVFSTKERQALITSNLQNRLWAYMGGIARENHMKALSVGGTQDHAHILLSLPATLPVAKAVQLIKGGSSKWVHETFADLRKFAWQAGYGAFSVNVSLLEETIRYIERQAEHHQRKTFQEEYIEFLKRHGIDYDERYVWG